MASDAYNALPERGRELVDEAAAKAMDLFGLTLDEARDLVMEHVLQKTGHNGPGTGH